MSLNKKYVFVAILYMLLIFALSSIPVDNSDGTRNLTIEVVGNFAHIPLFGLLAYLWMKTFLNKGVRFNKALIYTMIITITYAAFDEFHQSFVPGRNASILDFMSDTLGCAVALFIYKRRQQ